MMTGSEVEIIDTLKDKEVISVLESSLVAINIPENRAAKFDAFLIDESLLNRLYGEVNHSCIA